MPTNSIIKRHNFYESGRLRPIFRAMPSVEGLKKNTTIFLITIGEEYFLKVFPRFGKSHPDYYELFKFDKHFKSKMLEQMAEWGYITQDECDNIKELNKSKDKEVISLVNTLILSKYKEHSNSD